MMPCFLINENSMSLHLGEHFLESFNPGMAVFKITAAATTGPAKAPRPASSTPANIFLRPQLRYGPQIQRNST